MPEVGTSSYEGRSISGMRISFAPYKSVRVAKAHFTSSRDENK